MIFEETIIYPTETVDLNREFLTKFLYDWIPLNEWQEYLEEISRDEIHFTMQVAARQLLVSFEEPVLV